MGASLERIRKSMNVEPTAQDKGLTLTMTVTAYDNGMVQLNGIPINDAESGYEAGKGWLGTAEVAMATLNEFRRQADRRRISR